ncbi:MAG TPA: metallophosphoesterase family protein [Chloroflexota bacterium]|nr:metallophosphoesterase family protein [Chloroflexota bacterium]
MRFALFSDVHGNLAGLRAVAAALKDEQPLDHVVVAGDHLQGGPRPREVWELLTSRGWILVRGNEDDSLIHDQSTTKPPPPNYRQAFQAQINWTRDRVGPTVLAQIASLSERWQISTPAGDLLVVHSSPRSIDDRCGGLHNSSAEVAEAYGGTGAAAIAFGHYHRSFVRPAPFALLINVASVGLPVDQRPLAAYTVLTATDDGAWIVEQRNAPYRLAEESAAATANGLPPWVRDPE